MTSPRSAIVAAVLAVLIGAGLWALRARRSETPQPVLPATRPAVSATPLPAPTGPAAPPSGFRVAGVAGGGTGAFVAVEMPDGTSELFRVGDDVPGLGRLLSAEPGTATFAGEHGTFVMRIEPGPTRTAASEESPSPRSARTAAEVADEEGVPPGTDDETSEPVKLP